MREFELLSIFVFNCFIDHHIMEIAIQTIQCQANQYSDNQLWTVISGAVKDNDAGHIQ